MRTFVWRERLAAMSQYLLFFILGMSAGAVYATLAMGIVLTYQGTGVINFAAAAMATIPLYVFDDLQHGKLTLPVPWLPSFDWGPPPTWVAVIVSVLVAAGIGALIHLCVSRPLRTAPALAKVVAAVGVMLLLQSGAALKYGTDARPRDALLPTGTITIGGANVAVDRLWLIALVIVLGSALAMWFRRSRTGLAVQAAAENERAASFARLSPQTLGMVTWTLASAFVAFIMIMAGQATGVITPNNLTLLVVPALAAALIARLASLWAALIGGLLLGALQAELQFMSQTKSWWPEWAKQGITDAVPFIVIVITLFVLGKSIPMRGDDTRSSLPPVILPKNRPWAIAVVFGIALIGMAWISGSYRFGLITSLATALIALSLVVLTGFVGQISLAQAAFAGVAGLFVAKIGDSIPFPLSMLLAALGAMAAGIIVGLPALRIRGAQLAVVTLAAALTLEKFVFGNPQIRSPTADLVPNPELLGINLSVRQGRNIARFEFGLMTLIITTVFFVLVCNMLRAGTGRKMLAVRSNERAAASIGIGIAGIKLSAFALASFLAGIGGSLIAYSRGQLSAESFGVFVGLSFLATSYLGGITSASGAVWAGLLCVLGLNFVIVDRLFDFGQYYGIFAGLSLILTVLIQPLGIAGKLNQDIGKLKAKRAAKRAKKFGVDPAAEPVTPRLGASGANAKREIGEVVLRTEAITVTYGGVRAVDEVTIEVRAGEIVGLIGPNGAGKTSFVDGITGFTRCAGEVYLGDVRLTELTAHKRARAGLARTWQSVEPFEDMSVESNVRVADDVGNDVFKLLRDMVRPNPAPSQAVRDAMTLMSLDDVADRKPSELSLGRQKTLGVARSLAMKPTVLLLDEPAAGLDSAESIAFGDHLQQIAATGVGCLLIDHDMHLVLGVCDRIYVIEFGRQIADGTPDEVRRDPRVLAAYLGSDAQDHKSEDSALDGAPSTTLRVGS